MKALQYYIRTYGYVQANDLLFKAVQREDSAVMKEFFNNCLNRMNAYSKEEIKKLDPGYV